MGPVYDFDTIHDHRHSRHRYFNRHMNENERMLDHIITAMHSKKFSVREAMIITKELLHHMDYGEVIEFLHEFMTLYRNSMGDISAPDYYCLMEMEKQRRQDMEYKEMMYRYFSEQPKKEPKDFLSEKDMEL
jgi:hypothetical protein